MVQCSQCQTVLFIDFSGNVVVGESASEETNDDNAEGKRESVEEPSFDEAPFNEPLFDNSETNESQFETSNLEAPNFEEPLFEEPVYTSSSTDVPQVELQTPAPSLVADQQSTFEFVYKIVISGVDTSDLRTALIDSLRDTRLGLVNNEVVENLEQGQLEITGLNPIKASIIINSLKELPIDVHWELYDYHTQEIAT